jgi:ribosomal protein S18 acetylase RimI-like enzyme
MIIKKKVYTKELKAETQDFECGDDPWAIEIADWIKGGDPFYFERKRGTRTWLYYNDKGQQVGYGSLGTHTCPPLFPDEPEKLFQIIPNLGVRTAHQHQGYATSICGDLLYEAQEFLNQSMARGEPVAPLVSLFVHPQNLTAINLYRKVGFKLHHAIASGRDGGVQYTGMVVLLDSPIAITRSTASSETAT